MAAARRASLAATAVWPSRSRTKVACALGVQNQLIGKKCSEYVVPGNAFWKSVFVQSPLHAT
jgi:hypothetical protein